MKKVTALLAVLFICTGVFAGCSTGPKESGPASESPEVIRVSALKGPTAMGMVKLMQDSEDGKTANNYEFTIATTDEIIPKISTGAMDIAALPANLASVLYNNTDGAIQALAINTLGTLYVVEKGETISTVADLKGRTVYATGKGATPEFALNHVLSANGIDPSAEVAVEYKSEAAEIIPLLAAGSEGVAIIPQPFVTTAVEKVEGLRIALDWTEEWDKISGDDSALVTGVVVVRREFAEKYPEAVKAFAEEYADSTAYTESNLTEAAALVGKYGIVDAAVAEKAMPYCNITYIAGLEMKSRLSGYLEALHAQNPQSIGGTMPGDGFYYSHAS